MSRKKEKRCNCLSPRVVLSFYKPSGIVSVPGLAGRPISVAVEDVRHTVTEDEFAAHVRESIDQLYLGIDSSFDSSIRYKLEDTDNTTDSTIRTTHIDTEFYHDGQQITSANESLPAIGYSIEVS